MEISVSSIKMIMIVLIITSLILSSYYMKWSSLPVFWPSRMDCNIIITQPKITTMAIEAFILSSLNFKLKEFAAYSQTLKAPILPKHGLWLHKLHVDQYGLLAWCSETT
jgi:hypothetical protein